MGGKREVHYVVSRLADPDDLESAREPVCWYLFLNLAIKQANRLGTGVCVDAEGGFYKLDGPYRRKTAWQVEWTNRNLHQGKKPTSAQP